MRLPVSARVAVVLTTAAALAAPAQVRTTPDPAAPSVLFLGGVHSGYVARPLAALGVSFDSCPRGKLAERLATKQFNVVVAGVLDDADRKAVQDFLAAGGGVLVCNPESYPHEAWFTATCEWLASLGARARWELLQDTDQANVVRDVMGCSLSFSDAVAAPARDDGVRGVLTLTAGSTTGWEPPMSWELSPEWTVLVKGAASMKTALDPRNDPVLQPWLPKTDVASAPPLLAARQVGPGRLAVLGIRYYWLFTPPPNCPTAEAMLTAGAGGKPSAWLRVVANTCRWLAEPARAAGYGGATTPPALLDPPPQLWEPPPPFDWAKWSQENPLAAASQTQTVGLVGARTALSSGTGTVADFVREARAAGLQFLVFMEDALAMDEAKWATLVEQCQATSDDAFQAIPGLCYEDAQGNHLYAFSDNVKYPKPSMLLADKRLATVQPMRSRAYFDYDNEYIGQQAIRGYWNHAKNFLIPADYKLYNSFPVMSSLDGQPIDDNLADFLYLQGIGGCQCIVAFEFMTKPELVAQRARDGWRVVAHRPPAVLRSKWYEGAWSFSGSGSQYITQGPRILVWDAPNRLVGSNGQWWRPDQWQWRLRLKVAADAGLKSVTIHDGDRQVLRRWLPGGAKEFAQELVLANCQQLGPTLVVEDTNGRRAVSMSFWNRNLVKEEFFCSDRCNFLGSSRLLTRQGTQYWTPVGFQANMGITPSKGKLDMQASPAVGLTPNSPTLPIDGAPAGFPTCTLWFGPELPGEHPYIFAYPQTWLVSPEVGIGQADFRLAFDPAERGATKTPLGHDYIQPQDGVGNAWGGWHRLIPTRKAEGYVRTYAWNCVPGGGEFRIGWHEVSLTAKEDIAVAEGRPGLQVMHPSMEGWALFLNGQPVAPPEKGDADLPFTRGLVAVLENAGGSVVLMPLEGENLVLRHNGRGALALYAVPPGRTLAKGQALRYRIAFAGAPGATPGQATGTPVAALLQFARDFGVAEPGKTGYASKVTRGKLADSFLALQLEADGGAAAVSVPKVSINGLLPVVVRGLNDGWSVQLLNKAMPWPNHRALPVRGGIAYAALDLHDTDADLFVGHPVVCDNAALRIQAEWETPGLWYVELHNPTDAPVKTTLRSAPGWPLFTLQETVDLPAGSSRVWRVPVNGK